MYQRTYEDSGEEKTFRVGDLNIPASYRGNAFTADEMPKESECTEPSSDREDTLSAKASCEPENEELSLETCKVTEHRHDLCEKRSGGLLSGLLRGIGRDIELDDILLAGLIILMLLEKKKGETEGNEEILILLALLLIGGF